MTIPFLPSSLGAVLFFLTIHDLPAWPRRHLLSFLDAYEQLGLPMWGLSPQNEPTQKVRWNSMSWTAEAMRDFCGSIWVRNSGSDTQRLMLDDMRDSIITIYGHITLDSGFHAIFTSF
jgi:O-glycosyl hydrolase